MVFLFTDFGVDDFYVGQVHASLARFSVQGPVIDLMHNAPNLNPQASAYLLAALVDQLPTESIVMAVVDPGVGSERAPIMARVDQRWFVGPDNGLLSIVMRRSSHCACHRIDWRPDVLSNTFHGRDLFAPVTAMLSRGQLPKNAPGFPPWDARDWPDELLQIIHIDHYGNAVTGIKGSAIAESSVLQINGWNLARQVNFAAVSPGQSFWYTNSIGLVEIAANQASAAQTLGLTTGMTFAVATKDP